MFQLPLPRELVGSYSTFFSADHQAFSYYSSPLLPPTKPPVSSTHLPLQLTPQLHVPGTAKIRTLVDREGTLDQSNFFTWNNWRSELFYYITVCESIVVNPGLVCLFSETLEARQSRKAAHKLQSFLRRRRCRREVWLGKTEESASNVIILKELFPGFVEVLL